MANINLYSLYNKKRRQFGVNDSDRFREAFVDATNTAFMEFNDQVFQAETLSMIETFDDVIDTRLNTLTSLTFDSDCEAVMSKREYWAIEYDLEFTHGTNTFSDVISDDGSNVSITIADNVITFAGDAVGFTATIPDVYSTKLLISSGYNGIRVLLAGDGLTTEEPVIALDDIPDLDWVPDLELVPAIASGDSSTPQPIGTVTARVISSVTGMNLRDTRFYSQSTKLLDFPLNEGTGTTATDEVNSYTATIADPIWVDAYVEDSCDLSTRYLSPFSMALDYHLQDGGEWAIEPEESRERKWYMRGVRQARNINQQETTYTNPLGI